MSKLMSHTLEYRKRTIIFLFGCLILSCILAILYGSVHISFKDIIDAFLYPDNLNVAHILIRNVRVPRAIAGAFAGIGLSVSGVILQEIMNNSLVSPSLIGVNSGAGVAVLIIMAFFPSFYHLIPLAAFIGALVATLLIFTIAYCSGSSRMMIVLAGVAISSILNGVINSITLLYPDIAINSSSFMSGGLSGILIDNLIIPVATIIIAFMLCMLFSNLLNILSLGDSVASSLGLKVNTARSFFIVLSSILAGSAVSYAGLLGFVGLIGPHICRKIVGSDARFLIPCTAFFSGTFVVLCDLIERIIFAPYELPVGILMSFIGGPFFIYLLIKQKGRRLNA